MNEAWLRFKKKVVICPNHGVPYGVILQNFYRSLDSINKSLENNLEGGSLMVQIGLAKALLDRMTKTNRTWHTRETKVILVVTSAIMTNGMRRKKKGSDENMAKMMTRVELLAKHMMGIRVKSVNAIGSHRTKSLKDDVVYTMFD